ncbi:MAG: HAMP domain-containing histidine kinase [Desulfobacterales bacterium]|uniref:histidine kinase n=1 Tax=Candidatus Desulfatibia vada TaxID=2841696 RepID=A0A8J6NTW2_9BACT|nr:HAMP domain-containing histidine kinase [Candidatus Desulfatibia vada]MBL6970634.1 HAMP domain-containing histidine kinase [Desulfobacterales bacterium]
MFLKTLPKTFKSSGFRLSVWYSAFFITSSALLLIVAYFFLSSALKAQDWDAILSELNELVSEYEKGGLTLVESEVVEYNKFHRKNPFFIRIAENSNRTVHIFFPHLWDEFDLNRIETFSLSDNKAWISLPTNEDDYDLVIKSARLPDGRWLQVGMSTEDRQKILERFRETFLIIMLPLILFGLVGGSFLAVRTLRPIRDIIQTVQSIEIGRMEARVQRTNTGDELDELARLFNEMLDKISTLISGMKGSLDNVAHDLRTPMTRLRNISETALQAGQDLDLYREALADCIEESDHILNMLTILMDISEAETGMLSLDRKFVNISSLLARVVDMYQYVAEEKGVKLNVSAPDELYTTVDPNRLSQALANILDNAIKYTLSGGQVKIEAFQEKGELIIRINDTGFGISPKDLPQIWDRLFRTDHSRSQKGLGLGLSLVEAIILAHNGRVDVISDPGKGSTFTIFLPSIQ